MVICSVISCSNRSDRGNINKNSFFSIPSIIYNQCEKTKELSIKRRTAWIAAIKRADLDEAKVRNATVCNIHFIKGKPSKLFEAHDPDWIPTLQLGYNKRTAVDQELVLSRHERALGREVKRKKSNNEKVLETIQECVSEGSEQPQVLDTHITDNISVAKAEVMCQTELSMKDVECLVTECLTLNGRLCEMQKQLNAEKICESSFEADDNKVNFYTGISNYHLLISLFRFVSSHMNESYRRKLSLFQEFILVLMRFRLNLYIQDLAYRFNVAPSTVSRVFDKWLHAMHIRLSPLLRWPKREELQKTMPREFKNYFGNKVDCFEVFINRPSSLDTRAMTWSQYKHHNTVKFLIGVTPQGVIAFISNGWGGRVSDKYLTENSGILENLLPGDLVLADRGFDIAESVGFYCAELAIPAFTRGKKQLSSKEVLQTRRIAHLRIHVERVIGLVRNKYHILQSTLPIELLISSGENKLSNIDKIVRVCCALTNLCDSVIPID